MAICQRCIHGIARPHILALKVTYDKTAFNVYMYMFYKKLFWLKWKLKTYFFVLEIIDAYGLNFWINVYDMNMFWYMGIEIQKTLIRN
jgi:hypothetical protein